MTFVPPASSGDVRDAADLHAGEQHAGAGFDAADIARVQVQFVGAAPEAGALAELQDQRGQQGQPDEDEQPDFGFESLLLHRA